MKLQKILHLPVQNEFYMVIGLFLVVIFISVFGNKSRITPFSSLDSSLSPYPYREGFTNEIIKNNDINGGNKRDLGIFEVEGLNAGPLNSVPIHDPMSKLDGNSSCVGTSPFSNSLGGLCISSDAKRAFETRGGNFS